MVNFNNIIISIFTGIIGGIVEFLPISSTGHIIIVCHFLNVDSSNTKILEIFIQLGSGLAILCFFYKKILQIFSFKIIKIDKNIKNIHVFLSILPTIICGLLFYNNIKMLSKIDSIIYALILGGLFLIISEMFKPKQYKTCNIYDITLLQSIMIGCFQILSLFPGFSRSGATIASGILLGLKRSVAIEFSFIISIPLLIGASLFDFIKNINDIVISNYFILFTGFIISFIISSLCINMLLKILNKTSLIFFGIYRFIISGIIYIIN